MPDYVAGNMRAKLFYIFLSGIFRLLNLIHCLQHACISYNCLLVARLVGKSGGDNNLNIFVSPTAPH